MLKMLRIVVAAVPLGIISSSFILISTKALSSTTPKTIVPEVHHSHLTKVSQLVSSALGDGDGGKDRYDSVRDAVNNFQSNHDEDDDAAIDSPAVPPPNELVYGELSVPVLATILDAVGVQEDDVFLDIGSGDGALVLGASLLYASACNHNEEDGGEDASRCRNAIGKCYGVDIVPGLVSRSLHHAENLERILLQDNQQSTDVQTTAESKNSWTLREKQSEVQFFLGDIHKPSNELQKVLEETTIAVCFATTWSAGNAHEQENTDSEMPKRYGRSNSLQGRRLPKLSNALSSWLNPGCRVVIIDGKLNDIEDGFSWQGDLRIQCPDTAPYSTASLYHYQ